MKTREKILIALLALGILLGLGLCLARMVSAQDECIKVAHISDIHEYQMSYTDDQGRDICKLILHLHRANPGDPQEHITFNGSGEKQGYAASFAGAHVSAWRTTNELYISNADVFAVENIPTDTPSPTDTPAVTDPPPVTVTPTDTPEVEPPPVTVTPTETPPGVITASPPPPYPPPPVTHQPPNNPPKITQPPVLPETGEWGSAPMYGGIVLFCLLIGFVFWRMRR